MEKVNYPHYLIIPDSRVIIEHGSKIQFNNTKTSIIIRGNRGGFISLANLINVYNVYLVDPIVINEFSFVQSVFAFNIIEVANSNLEYGEVIFNKTSSSFDWLLSESAAFRITCLIHSLGYANNELHFDTDLSENAISIYCVVE